MEGRERKKKRKKERKKRKKRDGLMHIYFGERMLKGYCFPFLVRNCISYERIQYINDT